MLGSVNAGEVSAKVPVLSAPAPDPVLDPWAWATLYKNDANPYVQLFKLRGRYQGQYHWVESEQGDAEGWENRRPRLGFDAKLFRKTVEMRFEAQASNGFDPLYDRLADAWIKWKPSDTFSLSVGRQKANIGYYDWLEPLDEQPTFERSQIFGQLAVDRSTSVIAKGKVNDFSWQTGVYSNDLDREFGSLEGGVSFGAGIGYDFKAALNLARADWRLDWLHSEIEAGDSILNRYEDIFATTLVLKDGRWSLIGEAFAGLGGAPDVFGMFVQSGYDLLPKKLQVVGRVSFTTGDGPDSVRVQRRYEREVPDLTGGGLGERYHAAYLGMQYFINGDKLKLMAGAEYSHLDGGGNGGDFDGVTVLSGIRFSF